jgi:hypothetical protein
MNKTLSLLDKTPGRIERRRSLRHEPTCNGQWRAMASRYLAIGFAIHSYFRFVARLANRCRRTGHRGRTRERSRDHSQGGFRIADTAAAGPARAPVPPMCRRPGQRSRSIAQRNLDGSSRKIKAQPSFLNEHY